MARTAQTFLHDKPRRHGEASAGPLRHRGYEFGRCGKRLRQGRAEAL